jgi:hypothetical protein
MADPTHNDAISKWGPCQSLTEVKAFLGTIGVCRIYIQNFAKHATALISLTCKEVPFEFGASQIRVQEDLNHTLITSPAIHAIYHTLHAPIILAVDTLYTTIGFYLVHCDIDNPWKWYYDCFRSITLNACESHFLQPKLELYRLYCTLSALRFYLIGVHNLIVDADDARLGNSNKPHKQALDNITQAREGCNLVLALDVAPVMCEQLYDMVQTDIQSHDVM